MYKWAPVRVTYKYANVPQLPVLAVALHLNDQNVSSVEHNITWITHYKPLTLTFKFKMNEGPYFAIC